MLKLAFIFLAATTADAFVAPQRACVSVGSLRPRFGAALRALPPLHSEPNGAPDAVSQPGVAVSSAHADRANALMAFGLLAVATTLAPSEALAADSSVPVILGRFLLDPALNVGQFLMLIRVIMSWFPEVKINKMPWLLATFPTEGVLRATRSVIPPAFGVDISPVIWIAVLSFFREILFGQQGLFNIGAFD